jgi:hypothetical protein
MAKSKSSFDFPQMMMAYGERIGLGVSAVILVILLGSLVMAFASSTNPAENAKKIDSERTRGEGMLANTGPTGAEKPPEIGNDLTAFNRDVEPFKKYGMVPLVREGDRSIRGRKQPTIFSVDQAEARYAHVRIQTYRIDFSVKEPLIYVLERTGGAGGRPPGVGAPGGGPRGGGPPGGFAQLGGMPPGGMAPGGMSPGGGPRGGGGGLGGLPEQSDEEKGQDGKLSTVPLMKVDKQSKPPVQQLQPLRMAIIAGSFPYKKQLEEFQSKLALRDVGQVLNEASAEVTKTGVAPAFRFLEVEVERRELDLDGNPVTSPKGQWQRISLKDSYRPWLIRTGKRFEPDDPKLAPVIVNGLVMPRLLQFRADSIAGSTTGMGGAPGGPPGIGGIGGVPGMGENPGMTTAPKAPPKDYPDIESGVPNIEKTLTALKGKMTPPPATTSSQFSGDNFDPFNPNPLPPPGTGTGTMVGGEGGRIGGAPGVGIPPGTMIGGTPGPGMIGGTPGTGMLGGVPGGAEPFNYEPPEHCLVRLIDVTVEPGKTYEYRLRVKMANPNYKRKEVADPTYAQIPTLESEWSKMPIRVSVPPETRYYAVDQKLKDLSPDSKTDTARRSAAAKLRPVNEEKQFALQIHRWFHEVPLASVREPLLVGDWAVAERVLVGRGEYIGRKERIELPYWRYIREAYALATDTKGKPTIEVSFGESASGDQPEAILLDYSRSKPSYDKVVDRTDDNIKTQRIEDSAMPDGLLFTPDGRMLLLEGATDFADTERVNRLKDVREHVDAIKTRKPAGAGTNPGGVFGS